MNRVQSRSLISVPSIFTGQKCNFEMTYANESIKFPLHLAALCCSAISCTKYTYCNEEMKMPIDFVILSGF